MPKPKPAPMTPEQSQAHRKQQAVLAQATDAALELGIRMIKTGVDDATLHRAMREASAKVFADAGVPEPLDPEERASTLRPAPDLRADELPCIRADGWTPAKQRDFLAHLAENGCIGHACDAVGLTRQSAYALRRRWPNSVFAIGWDVAIGMSRHKLLDEAVERAFLGREVPVWYHGEQVGTRILHNDRLLMFLLARTPDPAHPALEPRELNHLFPAMLRMVDRVLPPAFSPERIAELTGGDAQSGR